ncbi:MAG: hypothetical protein JNM39_10930 [Bdellovibrionaceae bacterium]|nr:hypothetical protein [Pseudobdellovibrionaceae bacterium]
MFVVRKQRAIFICVIALRLLPAHATTLDTWMPKEKDSTKIVYESRTDDGIVLRPGEILPMQIPTVYHKRTIDFVALTHKQKLSDFRDDGTGRNETPGYTSFEILPSGEKLGDPNGNWRVWGGRGSGPLGSKYAENRNRVGETDNLYEWVKYGHRSIWSYPGAASLTPLQPGAFRIRSVGKGNTQITKVIVKFRPINITHVQDYIFSNGFAFGNYETNKGRRYPGNPDNGDYGDAIILNSASPDSNRIIPQGITFQRDYVQGAQISRRGPKITQLIVNIDPKSNKLLSFVDVACGDMNPVPPGGDPELLRGNGKLFVMIETDRGVYEVMTNENIGSNGVMRALVPSEVISGKITRVIISGTGRAPISVMGVRLGFE